MSVGDVAIWIMAVLMCTWVSVNLLSDKGTRWAGVLCTGATLVLCTSPLWALTAHGS